MNKKGSVLDRVTTEIVARPSAMLIMGPPGIGKSTLAGNIPNIIVQPFGQEDTWSLLKQSSAVPVDLPVLPRATKWLDLARYADSAGYATDSFRRIWGYRDWVIRAFNDNLGYDDFVRYQLAGDLYPNATNDQLVASGFNRLHLIIDRGTALPEESFFKNVVDRVTAVGTTFMGMTVHCATCHDHKYDPLTQKDFYSMFAFFNNIDAAPETVRPSNGLQPPFVTVATPKQKKELDQLNQQVAKSDQVLKALKKKVDEEKDPGKKKAFSQELKALTTKHNNLKKKRDSLNQAIPQAMVMKERKEVRPTHIMKRGQYDDPGELVTRDTPEFLPALKKTGKVATRMDLAQWFVDRNNPLTARVAVNRYWQRLFGVGLVKTSEDFGVRGELPSHASLLDWLAVEFVASGWDTKQLQRLILNSATYRQGSHVGAEAYRKDPDNRLLARGPRMRLDAEEIRDASLAVSGLLVARLGGRSVYPYQPKGLWMELNNRPGYSRAYQQGKGADLYRRSLYTFWKRTVPSPMLKTFDAPEREFCTVRRSRTNTPLQALVLLNGPQYVEAARRLAERMLTEGGRTLDERITYGFRLVTSRSPAAAELAIFQDAWRAGLKRYSKDGAAALKLLKVGDSPYASGLDVKELAAMADVARLLLNTSEAITKG